MSESILSLQLPELTIDNIIVKPLRPKDQINWSLVRSDLSILGIPAELWIYNNAPFLKVISAVEPVGTGHGEDRSLHYHVSISRGHYGQYPLRATSNQAKQAVIAFGIQDGEEDNHVPDGVVRNFFMSVNEEVRGIPCECVGTEIEMSLDKGDFIWRPV